MKRLRAVVSWSSLYTVIVMLRRYASLIWHFFGKIYWKLRAHEKNRKDWFVDLFLIFRNETSQIVFHDYTHSYSIVTRSLFRNFKIYLLSKIKSKNARMAHKLCDITDVFVNLKLCNPSSRINCQNSSNYFPHKNPTF